MEPLSSHSNQPPEPAKPRPQQASPPSQEAEATAGVPDQPAGESYVSNPFQVFMDSFKKLFTVNFVTLLGIIGVVVLTFVVILVALFSIGSEGMTAAGLPLILEDTITRIIVAAAVALLLIMWSVILEAAWQKYSIETVRSNSLSFGQAMRAGFQKGPGLLVIKIITGLAVLVGLILLIVPGLVLWYWFFFVKQAYVDKDIGIIASLKESKRLVKGKLVELFGLFGASLVFALPVMVPLLGILYQIVLTPVIQLAWQYRYTSADMLDRTGLPKPPTHVANKVMVIVTLVIVVLILVLAMIPYIMMGNSF